MSIFRIKIHSIKVGYRLLFNNLKSLVKAIASGNIFKGQKKIPQPEIRINDEYPSSLYTAKEFELLPEGIITREESNITLQTMFIKPPIGVKIIKKQFEEILTTNN